MVLAAIKILGGLVLLVAGGEVMVRGASRLALTLRISPLVIGMTVVAFGTSAPELAVSVQAAWAGSSDLTLGNVVGSNIFNVLLTLGISAMIVPLVVSSDLIRREVPIMIGVSLLLPILGGDGSIGKFDGLFLSTCVITFTWWSIRRSRRASQSVQEEFAQELPTAKAGMKACACNVLLIVAGLILLGIGSQYLVDGAVFVATTMGVSELVIGLTVVAAGTSMPEVATSLVAAWRGERDIAVGNIVGSNIFNILCVLGFSGLFAPHGITVSSTALWFDIPVMVAVAFACLPVFYSGNRIARWEGGLFFFYYLAYTACLVLDATSNSFSRSVKEMLLGFAIPLTLITLSISATRSYREMRREQQT